MFLEKNSLSINAKLLKYGKPMHCMMCTKHITDTACDWENDFFAISFWLEQFYVQSVLSLLSSEDNTSAVNFPPLATDTEVKSYFSMY